MDPTATNTDPVWTPDMRFNWSPRPVTTPSYPQQRTLQTWGAIGAPDNMGSKWNPKSPAGIARTVVGMHGLGLGDSIDTVYVLPPWMWMVCAASSGVSAYHGMKRHKGSVGWAIGWGMLGWLFPVITPAVAFAQGYAKPQSSR
jgi:hypothetical protein